MTPQNSNNSAVDAFKNFGVSIKMANHAFTALGARSLADIKVSAEPRKRSPLWWVRLSEWLANL